MAINSRSANEEAKLARVADAASSVVRRVGRWLRYERQNILSSEIENKNHGDFVSRADRTSDSMLREDLTTILPGSGVISEEDSPLKGITNYRWIVDPLDGTSNYLTGLPTWAVSVALEDRTGVVEGWGDIVLGVIYLPELDRMYTARQGAGVRLNGKLINVSDIKLGRSTVSHWWPMDNEKIMDDFCGMVKSLKPQVGAIRNLGCPAAELAMIAEGTLEGFWATDMEPWDLAAGILMVEEAGGVTSDPWSGNPLDSGFPIAGNREIVNLIRSSFLKEND